MVGSERASMSAAAKHAELYAKFAKGKRHRALLSPCAGCLRPNTKPYVYATFASEALPVAVDYVLCKSCGKNVQDPHKRQRMAATVEENLEALGAFELDLKRGEA